MSEHREGRWGKERLSRLKAEVPGELCALDRPGGRGGSDGCFEGKPELSSCRMFEAGWRSAQDSGGRMPTSHLRGAEQVGPRHRPSGPLAHKVSGGASAVANSLHFHERLSCRLAFW